VRDRYNAFIERHEVAWELAMAFLAILFVAIGFALEAADPSISPALESADLALTVVFAVEFASRFAASYDRRQYLRGHWIDVLALLPIARGVRVARLARLFRLVRVFAGVFRAVDRLTELANYRGLTLIIISWLGVMVIFCLGFFLAERDINPDIRSPFDALWWGISTLTTVGYGDVYPRTAEGRIAASGLMLLGVGLFSAVTAIVSSYLISQSTETLAKDPIATIDRLGRLARDGMITADEFASKRGELLARI
jgi:voltage-gated potassium channel